MVGVEFLKEDWVQYIISGYPRSLFWAVPLPVDEIFQMTASASGVQNLLDLVDGFFFQD
jgi:hypothetical protein